MLLTPNKEGIEPRVPSGSNLKTSLQKCYGRHHDLVNLTEHLCQKRHGYAPYVVITVKNDHGYAPYVVITIKNDHGYAPYVVITIQLFPHL